MIVENELIWEVMWSTMLTEIVNMIDQQVFPQNPLKDLHVPTKI